jgi:hypothetical protein
VVLTVAEDNVVQAVVADGGCGKKKEKEEKSTGVEDRRLLGLDGGCVGFLWW